MLRDLLRQPSQLLRRGRRRSRPHQNATPTPPPRLLLRCRPGQLHGRLGGCRGRRRRRQRSLGRLRLPPRGHLGAGLPGLRAASGLPVPVRGSRTPRLLPQPLPAPRLRAVRQRQGHRPAGAGAVDRQVSACRGFLARPGEGQRPLSSLRLPHQGWGLRARLLLTGAVGRSAGRQGGGAAVCLGPTLCWLPWPSLALPAPSLSPPRCRHIASRVLCGCLAAGGQHIHASRGA